MSQEYDNLIELYQEIILPSSISSVLYWDMETNKLPKMGVDYRSRQLGYLTKQQQKIWTSDKLREILGKVEKTNLNNFQKRNYNLIKRAYEVKNNLSENLLSEITKQSSLTNEKWKVAKKSNDIGVVVDDFEKLFNLQKKYATEISRIREIKDPFSALIDYRDEGLNGFNVSKYFNEIKPFLIKTVKKKMDNYDNRFNKIKKLDFNKEEQKRITHLISDLFEYRYSGKASRGNIDEVEHPLTITCGPDDVRITVKFGNVFNVISSTNHELGHAIHKLNKNEKWNNLPVNNFGSPTQAEMISRYTENKIGKSFAFNDWMLSNFKNTFSSKFDEITSVEYNDFINLISPSTSRMNADEVSYGLHIIIRFEIESLLFNEKIMIKEVSQIWNEKYEKYLGVQVENDGEGILQDLHWFNTYWGYFHGYFMGDLIGSQIHYTMENELQDWDSDLRAGDLSKLLKWQSKKIYSLGASYPILDHLVRLTGENLNVKYHKKYLENKLKL